MENIFTYNDGRLSGGRYPKLWIIHRGEIHTFLGEDIAGVARIAQSEYEKRGKWSNTTYYIELAPNADAIILCAALHQRTWPENDRFSSYQRFLAENNVAVSFAVFCEALGRDYPRTIARMLKSEALRESFAPAGDVETISITVCKPCRRDPHQDVLITFNDDEYVLAHEASIGTTVADAAVVVAREHQPGYRDGYTTLALEVVAGTTVAIHHYEKDGEPDPSAIGREPC